MTCVQAAVQDGAEIALGMQDCGDAGLPRVLALNVGVLDKQQSPRSQQEGRPAPPVGAPPPARRGPRNSVQGGIVVADLRLAGGSRPRAHTGGSLGDDHVDGSAQHAPGPRRSRQPGRRPRPSSSCPRRQPGKCGPRCSARPTPRPWATPRRRSPGSLAARSRCIHNASAAEPERGRRRADPVRVRRAGNSSTWPTISSVGLRTTRRARRAARGAGKGARPVRCCSGIRWARRATSAANAAALLSG